MEYVFVSDNCPKGLLCRELKKLRSSGVVRSSVRTAGIAVVWTFS